MTPGVSETFALRGDEVPLSQLRSVLSAHYESLRRDSDRLVTRLTSFNLVVISVGEVEEELQELVGGLTESHPSRLLWCRLGRRDSWEDSTARVTLDCRCAGLEVCCEELILEVGPEVERVPSLLMSLTHSELPTYLIWWKAGPLTSSLFERLSDRARMTLWEPESDYPEPLDELERLWSDPYRQENLFYPLIWYRMAPVRRALAAAFDRGDFVVELAATGELFPTLLKAWLASRLHLKQLNPLTWKGGGVELQWCRTNRSVLVQAEERHELPLDPAVQAARIALDSITRDPIFEQLLQAKGY